MNKFEGMPPMVAIRQAKELGQEVKIGRALTGPSNLAIFRKESDSSSSDNVEQQYALGEIDVGPERQGLLDQVEWLNRELGTRLDHLKTRFFEKQDEAYGRTRQGYPKSFQDLGPITRFLNASKEAARQEIWDAFQDVTEVGFRLLDTIKTTVYQSVIDSHKLEQADIKAASEWIDAVRAHLVGELDTLEKNIG